MHIWEKIKAIVTKIALVVIPLLIIAMFVISAHEAITQDQQERERDQQQVEQVKKALCGKTPIEECDLFGVVSTLKEDNANQTKLLLAQGDVLQCLLSAHNLGDADSNCQQQINDFDNLQSDPASQPSASTSPVAPSGSSGANPSSSTPGNGNGNSNEQPEQQGYLGCVGSGSGVLGTLGKVVDCF